MSDAWTLLKLLEWMTGFFTDKGLTNPRLDAQLLLASVLGLDRVGLYLNYDRPLTQTELDEIRPLVKRRAQNEPLQYLLGKTEFWSLEFAVSPAVLIPRADTEILVEEALKKSAQTGELLDIGCGSGVIALSFASEKPRWQVTGLDISAPALELAAYNAQELGFEERSRFILGDLAQLPRGSYDLVVSNPPYISCADYAELMPEVRDFEPAVALLGGEDGLDCYRLLCRQVHKILKPGGWLLLEIGWQQQEAVTALLVESGLHTIYCRQDYAGHPRVIGARKG